jgi:hypothetical protein
VQRIGWPDRARLPVTVDGFQAGVVGNVLESGAPVLFDALQQPSPWRQILSWQADRQENGQRNAYGQRPHFFFPAICHSVNGDRTPRIFMFRQ